MGHLRSLWTAEETNTTWWKESSAVHVVGGYGASQDLREIRHSLCTGFKRNKTFIVLREKTGGPSGLRSYGPRSQDALYHVRSARQRGIMLLHVWV